MNAVRINASPHQVDLYPCQARRLQSPCSVAGLLVEIPSKPLGQLALQTRILHGRRRLEEVALDL